MNMRTTMKDIAKACGVSTATVSMALSGNTKRVSAATVAAICNKAQELNYFPNQMASSLARRKSRVIGIVVNDLRNSHIAVLFMAINRVLQDKGFSLSCHILEDNIDSSVSDLVMRIAAENVCALIWAKPLEPDKVEENERLTSIIERMGIPVFTMDDYRFECSGNNYCFDYERAGYMATKHLIDLGHRRIGCIAGTRAFKVTVDRIDGYKAALEEAAIPVNEDLIYMGDYTMESGTNALPYLLGHGVTAIFAQNDEMAFGVYKSARNYGVRVPEDLSLVGCDNVPFDEALEVPLSTIDVPTQAIGRKMAEDICEAIENEDPAERATKVYSPVLLVRGSTKRYSE